MQRLTFIWTDPDEEQAQPQQIVTIDLGPDQTLAKPEQRHVLKRQLFQALNEFSGLKYQQVYWEDECPECRCFVDLKTGKADHERGCSEPPVILGIDMATDPAEEQLIGAREVLSHHLGKACHEDGTVVDDDADVQALAEELGRRYIKLQVQVSGEAPEETGEADALAEAADREEEVEP